MQWLIIPVRMSADHCIHLRHELGRLLLAAELNEGALTKSIKWAMTVVVAGKLHGVLAPTPSTANWRFGQNRYFISLQQWLRNLYVWDSNYEEDRSSWLLTSR